MCAQLLFCYFLYYCTYCSNFILFYRLDFVFIFTDFGLIDNVWRQWGIANALSNILVYVEDCYYISSCLGSFSTSLYCFDLLCLIIYAYFCTLCANTCVELLQLVSYSYLTLLLIFCSDLEAIVDDLSVIIFE